MTTTKGEGSPEYDDLVRRVLKALDGDTVIIDTRSTEHPITPDDVKQTAAILDEESK